MTTAADAPADPAYLLPQPADVLLSDGVVAVVRPLRPDDRHELEALHAEVSDDSFRLRFFGPGRQAGRDYVEHLFSPAAPVLALVATVAGRLVALATAERVDVGTAEVAFLVADPLRGHGVGSLLLEHLAAAGRDRGIRRFTAEVLGENTAMSRVFRAAGFQATRAMLHGVVDVELSTEASAAAVAAADLRESRSEARSLAPLLHPRRVALIGVSERPGGVGRAILENVLAAGFTGDLVLVHPRASTIGGITAHPSLVAVPGHVDVAVAAVPTARMLEVTHDAVAAGVSTLVIISSGFAEVGPDGAALQSQLASLARQHSMRVVGPNGLGVMVNDPEVRLNATFTRLVPPAGGLALASQSGGVGIALLDVATRVGLGLSCFVSLGNKADVSGNDLLAAWLEDPRVTAAALYLESFGNAPKFARTARSFSERKPLLVVMGGRSAGGRRGGASHTAAAATPAIALGALLAHTGAIVCEGAESLAETALILARQPLPVGSRVGVLSNAGGMGVLAADAAAGSALVVPELSAEVRERLGRRGAPGTANPVDLGAAASAEHLGAATREILGSGEVDALVVVLVATSVTDPAPLVEELARARASHPGLPVLLVTMGTVDPVPDAPGVTRLSSVAAAVESLARVTAYAAWLRVPRTAPASYDPGLARASRLRAAELLAAGPAEGAWLDPEAARRLLAPYDLPGAGVLAHGAAEAAAAAGVLGFPVALKVADPRVVHKTDRGLVRTGLRTADEVAAAVRAFGAELGTGPADVLVQPMVAGVEMALGIVRDASFGPLVMVAAGGVATDLWDDRVFLVPPLGRQDAARAVRSLRSWPLLDGYRGSPAVDVAGLERCLVDLGRLAVDVPQVAELDLNPVIVGTDGVHLVDVKVRLAPAAPLDAGIPRRLRPTR